MTREEAIRKINYGLELETSEPSPLPGIGQLTVVSTEALGIALSALREQEERSKGCEYCDKYDDPCGVPMIATEEDECDRGIYLYNGWICANGGSFCEAKVKFCPMCGRKLEVEG